MKGDTKRGLRKMDWAKSFLLIMLILGFAIFDWSKNPSSLESNQPYGAIIVFGIYCLTFISLKISTRAPWYLILVSGTRANTLLMQKDERETSIIQKASLYSLASMTVAILLVSIVLIAVPAPSLAAVGDIFGALLFLPWSLLTFYCWLFGWRDTGQSQKSFEIR